MLLNLGMICDKLALNLYQINAVYYVNTIKRIVQPPSFEP